MPPGIETRGCQASWLQALRACCSSKKAGRATIFGAHLASWSKDRKADRRFLSEPPGFESVDAGRGWLIFALPACVRNGGSSGR
jgi:hypothetical protein